MMTKFEEVHARAKGVDIKNSKTLLAGEVADPVASPMERARNIRKTNILAAAQLLPRAASRIPQPL